MISLNKNFLFVILCGLLGVVPAVSSADSFQPPDAVLEIIKKSYSKFEIGNDSTCLRINSGGELCAIAIDKTVEENPDFRDIDMLLTHSKNGKEVDTFKIYDDFLSSDAILQEISKIDFKIWDKLKSVGKIFSITINFYGPSRIYHYHAKELTFFKLMGDDIIKISEPLSTYLYRGENDGQDKFSSHTEKRIILVKEQKNSQILVIKASVCEDDDATLEKYRCENKKPKWVNEEEVVFNDKSIKFLNKSYVP